MPIDQRPTRRRRSDSALTVLTRELETLRLRRQKLEQALVEKCGAIDVQINELKARIRLLAE